MSGSQALLRIQHYRYDVTFNSVELTPLGEDIVISSTRKIYNAKLFSGGNVDENDFLLCEELQICVASKNIAGAIQLQQQLANNQMSPEAELKLLSRHPQGLTLSFPCARLIGGDPWRFNAKDDQVVTLKFLARADTTGKVVKIL